MTHKKDFHDTGGDDASFTKMYAKWWSEILQRAANHSLELRAKILRTLSAREKTPGGNAD